MEELGKKLDQILDRLRLLEELILEKPAFEGLRAAFNLTRAGIGMYGEPLKIAARLRSAQIFLGRKDVAQDDISRCVVQALALKGPLNISATTRQVALMRGKASRRIVRERVKRLQDLGVIIRIGGETPRTYDLVKNRE